MESNVDRTDELPFHEHVEPTGEPGTKRSRLPHPMSLLLVGVLLALIGAGLAAWLPVQQMRGDIEALEHRGAVVGKQRGQHAWLEGWLQLPDSDMFPRVLAVDMSHTPATDADLAVISTFEHLRSLAFIGPEVTDAGLEQLQQLGALQTLLLIHCPQLSPPAIAKLQAALPELQIVRRGPAFLGIAGERAQQGCRVLQVVSETAAQAAGLLPRDIITAFDSQPTPDFETLTALIGTREPGDPIKLDVRRGPETLELNVVLGGWQ